MIVSVFFPPANSIAALRPYSWAKFWALQGHDVTVLTTKKMPNDRVDLKLLNTGYKVIEVEEPSFIKLLKSVYRATPDNGKGLGEDPLKGGLFTRVFRKLFFLLKSLFSLFRHHTGSFSSTRMPDFSDLIIRPALKAIAKEDRQWDLMVSTFGPYSSHLIGRSIKKKGMAKFWVADFRDLWVDNHMFSGVFPCTLFEKILERSVVIAADAITVISPSMADVMAKRYGRSKVHVLENGFDPEDLEAISKERFFPQDGKVRFVYTGTIYKGKRDPSPLFEAIGQISRDPATSKLLDRLEIIFAGPSMANLDELIEIYKVSQWVRNIGMKSREDSLRIQRDANVLVFLEWHDPSASFVLTGKLFEYLYAKRPILGIGVQKDGDAGKLMIQSGVGTVVGTDEGAIKEFLIDKLEKPIDSRIEIDQNILKRFERKELAGKLLGITHTASTEYKI